jgi:hypothetical protein
MSALLVAGLWLPCTALGVVLLRAFAPRRSLTIHVHAPVNECIRALNAICTPQPLGVPAFPGPVQPPEWVVGRVGARSFKVSLWTRGRRSSLVDLDGRFIAQGASTVVQGVCRVGVATMVGASAFVSLFAAIALALLVRAAMSHSWQAAGPVWFPACIALVAGFIVSDKLSFADGDARALLARVAGALSSSEADIEEHVLN